jgi:hypothetical protein
MCQCIFCVLVDCSLCWYNVALLVRPCMASTLALCACNRGSYVFASSDDDDSSDAEMPPLWQAAQ